MTDKSTKAPIGSRKLVKSAKVEQFNRLILSGLSQREAFCRCFPRKRKLLVSSIDEMASTWARSDEVQSSRRAMLRDAKIEDLDSKGQAHTDLLRWISGAEDAGNYTALAALGRLRSQHVGLAQESLTIHQDRLSDDALIKQIAGDDAQAAATLRKLLGKADFDPAPAKDEEPEETAKVVALHKRK